MLPATGLDIMLLSPSPSLSSNLASALLDVKFDDKRTLTVSDVLAANLDDSASGSSDDEDDEQARKRRRTSQNAKDLAASSLLSDAGTLSDETLRTRHVRIAAEYPFEGGDAAAPITVDYVCLCISMKSRPSLLLAMKTLTDDR